MEILILLGVLIAASLWVKNTYPDSEAAKAIDKLLNQGLSLVGKGNAPAPEKIADTVQAGSEQGSPKLAQAINQADKVKTPVAISESPLKSSHESKAAVAVNPVPEDSALRRHYLAHREAELRTIANPYPTDSALRGHYESGLVSPAIRAVDFVQPTVAPAAIPQTKLKAPEDAVLRRHFLTQLQAEIESTLFPRPTDSTLVRHYESHIQSEIATRLAEAV